MVAKGHHAQVSEFRNLVSLILKCPSYTLQPRKRFRTSNYIEILDVVKKPIQTSSPVCLTTYGLTSRVNCSITSHFIDGNELKSNLLSCVDFSERHTADNISHTIKEVTPEFGIINKISAVVTDNAANAVAAVRKLKWRWVGCFALIESCGEKLIIDYIILIDKNSQCCFIFPKKICIC